MAFIVMVNFFVVALIIIAYKVNSRLLEYLWMEEWGYHIVSHTISSMGRKIEVVMLYHIENHNYKTLESPNSATSLLLFPLRVY